jgi:hypothetical protein
MNNVYFACHNCKIYVDAGYRWAYWRLEEPGIVIRGRKVDAPAVLAAAAYWNPPQDESSSWLYERVLPFVRKFLEDHQSHKLVFGEETDFVRGDEFDWMQVGYLAMPTPRYLVEVLGFKAWDQVRSYMEQQKPPPPWWEVTWGSDPSPHERGKRKFRDLVARKYGDAI